MQSWSILKMTIYIFHASECIETQMICPPLLFGTSDYANLNFIKNKIFVLLLVESKERECERK